MCVYVFVLNSVQSLFVLNSGTPTLCALLEGEPRKVNLVVGQEIFCVVMYNSVRYLKF